MEEETRVTLEEIINTIGEDAGKKYVWFLIDFEAQGIISENLTIEDIRDKIESEKLGYYEASWDFINEISKKLSAVVVFHLVGFKSKEDFFKQRTKAHIASELVCEIDFDIDDGEIWEITGTDIALVERLKNHFSPLPILLM